MAVAAVSTLPIPAQTAWSTDLCDVCAQPGGLNRCCGSVFCMPCVYGNVVQKLPPNRRHILLTCPTGHPTLSFCIVDALTTKPCMGPWCAASLYVAPLRFLVRPLQLPPGPLERSGCFRCTPSLAARCDSDMVVGFLPWCALTQVANEVDLRLAAGQPVVQTQDTSPAALKPPAQVEMTRAAAPAAHGVEK